MVIACVGACAGGQLHCLQYLHEIRAPWGEGATIVAAHRGHLDCLLYAHRYGCAVSTLEHESQDGAVRHRVTAYFQQRGVNVVNLHTFTIRNMVVKRSVMVEHLRTIVVIPTRLIL